MSIFLDYYKSEGEVQLVSILDEDGFYHDFEETDFSGVAELLFEPGFIVVFGITRAPLERLFADDPRIRDFAIRYRWLDIQAEIRKKADMRPTLRNVYASTIGESTSKWGDLERREYLDYSSDSVLNRTDVAHDRLKALKEIYDAAMLHSQLSYFHKEEMFLVDIEWTEPGHPLTIEHTAEGIERTRDI